jgi:tetratricopeptide (TPR) repeat protein
MIIKNTENQPLEEVEVTLQIEDYMAEPRQCRVSETIPVGEQVPVALMADFSKVGLDFPEEKTVRANINVSYKYKVFRYNQDYRAKLSIKPNNTIRWDDLRKAGLFVTEEDPAITEASHNIAEIVDSVSNKELDQHMAYAMGLYHNFAKAGLVLDSEDETPYSQYAGNPELMDTVRFPAKTIEDNTGDSLELTLLCMSFLEAAGIDTAFVALPDRMLCAFRPELEGSELKKEFFHQDELIITEDDTPWMVLDISDLSRTFRRAFSSGALLWRENRDTAELIPLEEARDMYQPAAYPDSGIDFPIIDGLGEIYKVAERSHIDWMITEKVESLQNRIDAARKNPPLRNQLGVLYARYGMHDEAVSILQEAVIDQEYMPALVNLGHIYYLQDDLEMAQPFYQRAYDVAPFDPRVLLSLATANHRLKNYGNAQRNWEKLQNIDPDLAEKYSYLNIPDENAYESAEGIDEKDIVVWITE